MQFQFYNCLYVCRFLLTSVCDLPSITYSRVAIIYPLGMELSSTPICSSIFQRFADFLSFGRYFSVPGCYCIFVPLRTLVSVPNLFLSLLLRNNLRIINDCTYTKVPL